jgi:H+/Cl- antiporter ClcA
VAETVGVAAVANGNVATPISAAIAMAEMYRSFMALPTLILVSSVSG